MLRFSLLTLALSSYLFAQNYAIGHIETHFFDAARNNRDVWTEVYYPALSAGDNTAVLTGTYPVIVFGHGFVMSWDSYDYFWEYFVPKGYICVFARTEGGFSPSHSNFAGDLAYLAALFPQLNTDSNSPFFQHVQPQVALMGHSMGGGSAVLAAANNSQITTLVTLAAANTNPSAIAVAQDISVPSLFLAGEKDCVTPPLDHQIPMYDSTGAACKYYVEITGGSHCRFSNGSDFNCNFGEGTACIGQTFTSLANQHSRMLGVVEPWLNYYLKGDNNAVNTLNSFLNTSTNAGELSFQYDCSITHVESKNALLYQIQNQELKLQLPYPATISLIDLQGKTHLQASLPSGKSSLPIPTLTTGIYVLQVSNSTNFHSFKIYWN